jgi:hypothetical protein
MMQTATTPPGPQRLRALERANEVRLARAQLKRRIAGGDMSAAEIILNTPREATSWSVRELLMSQRRWGSQRCRRFLELNGINELKPVGGLTDRQKLMLAAQLGTCPEPMVLTEPEPEPRRVLQYV